MARTFLKNTYKVIFVLFTIFSIILFLIFIVNRCSNNQVNVIRVGVIAPLTSNQSRNAEMMMSGFKIAAEEDSISLVVEDSQDSPNKAKSAALKLITQDKVVAILGDSRSAVTKSIADETDNNLLCI